MKKINTPSIVEHFENIKDFRRRCNHPLIDIIIITICATICNANTWVDIELWGKTNIDWLKKFLRLTHGIPSHDTFGRFFSIIRPEEFAKRFMNWTTSLSSVDKDIIDIIPIDGKTLRHSYDKKSNRSAIHIVNAWSTKNKICLGQVTTSEKSNEITAIPELLDFLAINGCIITIDAMGCQKEITHKIIENGGDYVIAVKENQPTLLNDIVTVFEDAIEEEPNKVTSFFQNEEIKNGEKINRSYYISESVDELENGDDFANIESIGMVETKRTKGDGSSSYELRFYILSFITTAVFFASCVRGHWAIENSLHWTLDVTFNEDASRIRKGYAAENMSTIRKIALNLIKKESSTKKSMNSKRLLAGWNKSYLEQLIGL